MPANTSPPAKRSARRGSRRRRKQPKASSTPSTEGVSKNMALVKDLVVKGALAPLNVVLLTRRHIEEVVEDAVARGRITRDDAQQMIQSLLQRGTKQTDDLLADMERLLGRSRLEEAAPPEATSSEATGSRGPAPERRRARRATTTSLPFPDYDELSAAKVQERVGELSTAELRKLRSYERGHANRKTVLDAIERKLR